jgi:hypothetical protein
MFCDYTFLPLSTISFIIRRDDDDSRDRKQETPKTAASTALTVPTESSKGEHVCHQKTDLLQVLAAERLWTSSCFAFWSL